MLPNFNQSPGLPPHGYRQIQSTPQKMAYCRKNSISHRHPGRKYRIHPGHAAISSQDKAHLLCHRHALYTHLPNPSGFTVSSLYKFRTILKAVIPRTPI